MLSAPSYYQLAISNVIQPNLRADCHFTCSFLMRAESSQNSTARCQIVTQLLSAQPPVLLLPRLPFLLGKSTCTSRLHGTACPAPTGCLQTTSGNHQSPHNNTKIQPLLDQFKRPVQQGVVYGLTQEYSTAGK